MFVHMVFYFIPTHIWGIKLVGITSKSIGKDHEEIARERRRKNAGTCLRETSFFLDLTSVHKN